MACPCFVIAEAGVNHNGDINLARRLIEVAAGAGADAVKFQTFKADRLVIADAPKAEYQKHTSPAEESQFDMLRRLELSTESHIQLMAHAGVKGIMFLSTPFDEECAEVLDALGVPAFKVPSGEITNLPFLEYLAHKGKPMIVSTGMSTLGEVEQAVEVIVKGGSPDLALLHCVSSYPAEPADVNLCAMQTMARAFGVPVGYSDHTLGIEVALAAVALGACIIEKHFTLDRNLPGPDHPASLEPEELRSLVQGIRNVEASLGHGRKVPVAAEADTAAVARKSLVSAREIQAGETITAGAMVAKRPGTGLPPNLRPFLIGRKVRSNIPAGALLSLEMLA